MSPLPLFFPLLPHPPLLAVDMSDFVEVGFSGVAPSDLVFSFVDLQGVVAVVVRETQFWYSLLVFSLVALAKSFIFELEWSVLFFLSSGYLVSCIKTWSNCLRWRRRTSSSARTSLQGEGGSDLLVSIRDFLLGFRRISSSPSHLVLSLFSGGKAEQRQRRWQRILSFYPISGRRRQRKRTTAQIPSFSPIWRPLLLSSIQIFCSSWSSAVKRQLDSSVCVFPEPFFEC
ncbi:hypothetical protein F2Q70_00036283 [Brassica cretica]|uniref:Uncharacterized protein n=1 Tax=Brassica cretica TaxID=69181 RepID=A0A8S9JUU0_BRACR|nr:hypothetical protein F2Q70_00036283 [Brassica cretica]